MEEIDLVHFLKLPVSIEEETDLRLKPVPNDIIVEYPEKGIIVGVVQDESGIQSSRKHFGHFGLSLTDHAHDRNVGMRFQHPETAF
jgi:hypothetical protein